MPSIALLEAIAVTAELCGRVFTAPAAKMFAHDLSRFPEEQVLAALTRCRREVRGVLTVQDVVSRIDDGRPGPDEAWALMPRDETQTIVWTDEMASAWGVALPLLDVGDNVGARLAFREAYARAVTLARDAGRAPHWQVSYGTDPHGRLLALLEAADRGRITREQAHRFAPHELPTPEGLRLLEKTGVKVKRIGSKS
jgi:hypothetical protein